MKTCLKCHTLKSPSDFTKNAKASDGLDSYCKACRRALAAKRYSSNAAKSAASSAKWRAANQGKIKARRSQYYAANATAIKAKVAEWQRNNRAKCNVTLRKWKNANPVKCRAQSAKWDKANPESKRINAHNRRARIRGVGGQLSSNIAERFFKIQRGKCACCKKPLGDNYQRDHVVPLALGGANEDRNIQLLRAKCNMQKGSSNPTDFMRRRGFLL